MKLDEQGTPITLPHGNLIGKVVLAKLVSFSDRSTSHEKITMCVEGLSHGSLNRGRNN